jgi:hypothetical protein
MQNGYPQHIINKGLKEGEMLIKRFNQQQQQKQNDTSTKKNIYFIMNYYGNETLVFAKNVKKQCEKLIPNIKINFAFKKTNSLMNTFLPIHKGNDINRKDRKIIYKINCKNCDSVYIGETARDKKTRIKEHISNVKKMESNSKIFQHVYDNTHSMDFDNALTLAYEAGAAERFQIR